MLTEALTLAEAGWHIFPCRPGRKEPLTPNGAKAATTDVGQVLDWWLETPDANIGLVPGLSGCVVVDIDCKGGIDGMDALIGADMDLADAVVLEQVPVIHTPSGGRHAYLRFDRAAEFTMSNGRLAGVDLRAAGGYVVAPGSVVGGKTYTGSLPSPDALATPFPQSLLPYLTRKEKSAGIEIDKLEPADGATLARAVDWLRGAPNAIESGDWLLKLPKGARVSGTGRDNLAHHMCNALLDIGLCTEQAMPLLEAWDQQNDPPLEWDTLEVKWTSAVRSRQNPVGCSAEATGGMSAAEVFKHLLVPEEQREAVAAAEAAEGMSKFDRLSWSGGAVAGDIPEPRWLVDNFIPEVGVGCLSAREKTGKSFMALDLALHVATGKGEWGGMATKAGPVVYLAFEHAIGIRRRTAMWAQHYGAEVPSTFTVVDMHMEGMFDPDLPAWLAAKKPALIIVDTMTKAVQDDMLDGKAATAFCRNLDMLSNALQTTILCVAHRSKSKTDETSIFGSVMFQANFDFIHFLDHDDYGNTIWNAAKGKETVGSPTATFKPVVVDMGPEWGDNKGRVFEHVPNATIKPTLSPHMKKMAAPFVLENVASAIPAAVERLDPGHSMTHEQLAYVLLQGEGHEPPASKGDNPGWTSAVSRRAKMLADMAANPPPAVAPYLTPEGVWMRKRE